MKKNIFRILAGLLSFPIFSVLAAEGTIVNTQNIQFNGDFRYRHEWVKQEAQPVSAYHQHRIRARLGAKASVNEDTQAELRLATSTGRTSTNQTLGGSASAFSNYTITLDRANFKWNAFEQIYVSGGRMGNPYFNPGESDLLWDSDLNFDGMSVTAERTFQAFTPFMIGTFYWIDKTTTVSRKDVTLNSFQLGKHKPNDHLKWTAGVALHKYNGLAKHNGLVTTGDTNGNSFVSAGSGTSATQQYEKDFNVLDWGLEVGVENILPMPLVFLGEYVRNLQADADKGGYILGAKYGKPKERWDWVVSYDYRKLGKDSTVGAFTDGDSWGGGADGRGHRVSAGVLVGKSWTTLLTYYNGSTRVSAAPLARQKIHADLVFKF